MNIFFDLSRWLFRFFTHLFCSRCGISLHHTEMHIRWIRTHQDYRVGIPYCQSCHREREAAKAFEQKTYEQWVMRNSPLELTSA